MEALEAAVAPPARVEKEQLLTELYVKTFPLVARFVSRMGGTLPDAKDIFQDALVIYYEKQVAGTRVVVLSAEAYILGIAKHLWLRKFRQNQARHAFSPEEAQVAIPPDYFREADNRLLALVQLSGKKCLQLLQAFYYDKLGLPDIACAFGYQNVRSATVQKYKCLEKIRTQVKEKAISYEDLAA
jgi:DNA-directed RNA polymerase specialized sigma24 family protein